MRVRDEERETYVFLRTKIHERHGANKKFQKKRQNKRKEEREKGEEEVLRNTPRRACMRERARMNRRSMRVKKTKCYERRS